MKNKDPGMCKWLKHTLLMCVWKETVPQTNIQAWAMNEASTTCYFLLMDQMSGALSQSTQSQFLIGKLRVLQKGEFENLTTFGEESESTIVSLFFLFTFWGCWRGSWRGGALGRFLFPSLCGKYIRLHLSIWRVTVADKMLRQAWRSCRSRMAAEVGEGASEKRKRKRERGA